MAAEGGRAGIGAMPMLPDMNAASYQVAPRFVHRSGLRRPVGIELAPDRQDRLDRRSCPGGDGAFRVHDVGARGPNEGQSVKTPQPPQLPASIVP
jgi:hypothetical protein